MLLESSLIVQWMDDKLLDGDDEWNGDEDMMLLCLILSGSDGVYGGGDRVYGGGRW